MCMAGGGGAPQPQQGVQGRAALLAVRYIAVHTLCYFYHVELTEYLRGTVVFTL